MSDQELVDQLDEVKATGEESETNDPVAPAGGSPKKNRKGDKEQGDKAAPKADTKVAATESLELDEISKGLAVRYQKAAYADMKKKNDWSNKKRISGIETSGRKIQAGGDPWQRHLAKQAGTKVAATESLTGMKEAVDELFAGDDLSEEFKEKATVVFEAAVFAKLNEEVARLEEEFEAMLEEQADIAVSELVEKVDSYLDYVVEQWMEANELAIEKGIRSEIAESFIDGLRELFVEHNISIPEEDVDVIADIQEQLEETEEALNEALNEAIELRSQLEESKRVDVFETISESLTDTQAEKLKSLTEGLEFADLDDYKRKVEIVKENYFGGSKTELTEEVDEIDPIEEEVAAPVIDESVAKYADAISRTLRK